MYKIYNIYHVYVYHYISNLILECYRRLAVLLSVRNITYYYRYVNITYNKKYIYNLLSYQKIWISAKSYHCHFIHLHSQFLIFQSISYKTAYIESNRKICRLRVDCSHTEPCQPNKKIHLKNLNESKIFN